MSSDDPVVSPGSELSHAYEDAWSEWSRSGDAAAWWSTVGDALANEDYDSLRETAYLPRNPANARRLLAAIGRLEDGGGEVHGLADLP